MDSKEIISIENWQDYAECKGMTRLFFDQKGETPNQKLFREDQAKAICAKCVVVETCLDEAITNNEYGIWGGKTERERRRIWRNKTTRI